MRSHQQEGLQAALYEVPSLKTIYEEEEAAVEANDLVEKVKELLQMLPKCLQTREGHLQTA